MTDEEDEEEGGGGEEEEERQQYNNSLSNEGCMNGCFRDEEEDDVQRVGLFTQTHTA